MNISTNWIVSNSEMIKNYKICREKAQSNGKIFIIKNNQPDAVLFSVDEYKRIADFIEYMENIEDKDIEKIFALLPKEEKKSVSPFDHKASDFDNKPPEE